MKPQARWTADEGRHAAAQEGAVDWQFAPWDQVALDSSNARIKQGLVF
jgi:hypothetical protein